MGERVTAVTCSHPGYIPWPLRGRCFHWSLSMNLKEIAERCRKLADPYRVSDGQNFQLQAMDPGDVGDLTAEDKPRAKEALAIGVQALAELQGRLYAQNRWGVLVI